MSQSLKSGEASVTRMQSSRIQHHLLLSFVCGNLKFFVCESKTTPFKKNILYFLFTAFLLSQGLQISSAGSWNWIVFSFWYLFSCFPTCVSQGTWPPYSSTSQWDWSIGLYICHIYTHKCTQSTHGGGRENENREMKLIFFLIPIIQMKKYAREN